MSDIFALIGFILVVGWTFVGGIAGSLFFSADVLGAEAWMLFFGPLVIALTFAVAALYSKVVMGW